MILHLIHDDKVLPRMIAQFEEVCPGNNVYLCVIRTCDSNYLRFLHDNPYVVRSDSEEVESIPWENIDKICIHYLSFSKIRCYLRMLYKHHLDKCKVIWIIWGGDIYDVLERRGFNQYSEDNSYLSIRNLYRSGAFSFKSLLRSISSKIHNCITDFAISIFVDKRVDYIVCTEEEYNLFTRYLRFSKCVGLLKYNYYPIEDTLGTLVDKKISGNSIIVGNSASESNNHEYILGFIDNLEFGDRRVYVPLSYGEDVKYISIIEDKFRKISNTVILKRFLPLEEYHNLLINCSTFVYGNFRQEAWGNILVALYMGGKVYLSENSILSRTLIKAGYKIFITEHIKETFHIELTEEEKDNNRRIAMDTCSREQNRKNIEYICGL